MESNKSTAAYLSVVVPGKTLFDTETVVYDEQVNEKDTTQIQCLTYSRRQT